MRVVGVTGFEPATCRRGDRGTRETIKFGTTSPSLEVKFTPDCLGAALEFLGVHERPWHPVLRRFRLASVMTPQAISKVRAGTDIAPSVFFAPQDVNVKHEAAERVVGVTGFEPATSWSQTRRSTKLSYTPSNGGVFTMLSGQAHAESRRPVEPVRTNRFCAIRNLTAYTPSAGTQCAVAQESLPDDSAALRSVVADLVRLFRSLPYV